MERRPMVYLTTTIRKQCHVGCDCCPHTGCFFHFVKCSMVWARCAAVTATDGKCGMSSSHIFLSGGCQDSWSIGRWHPTFSESNWLKNDTQHGGSTWNGILLSVTVRCHNTACLANSSFLSSNCSILHIIAIDTIITVATVIIIIIIVYFTTALQYVTWQWIMITKNLCCWAAVQSCFAALWNTSSLISSNLSFFCGFVFVGTKIIILILTKEMENQLFTGNTQRGCGPPPRDWLTAFRTLVDAVTAAEFAMPWQPDAGMILGWEWRSAFDTCCSNQQVN